MSKSTYLSAQLRESAPYLRDIGWRETADLLTAAAAEIEELRAQLAVSAAINEPVDQANEGEWRRIRKA
jgi:hypothetical protein